jgi:ABC-2 type transport system ATP-binding protein
MSSGPALVAHDLGKTYRLGLRMRLVEALSGLELKVDEGSIYGFVGPNGAGKSTTIKILVGLIAATSGSASIFGHDIAEPQARRVVGYLPENPSFHDFLRPLEALELLGRLSGMSGPPLRRRCEELLELVGLAHARDLTVRKFSKGMVQRLGLAQAIVHDPPLLILDEPMSGLDPIGRKDVRDLIFELRRRGKTIFFSTHILGDVEVVCDRVGMLLRGKLVAEGPLHRLLDGSIRAVELRCEGLASELASRLERDAIRVTATPDGNTYTFRDVSSANAAAGEVLRGGGRVVALQPIRETLEESFMRLARAEAARAEPLEPTGQA